MEITVENGQFGTTVQVKGAESDTPEKVAKVYLDTMKALSKENK